MKLDLLLYCSISIMSKKNSPPSWEQTQRYDRITKIETKIIDKISNIKKEHRPHCESPSCQPYDSSTDYYEKFWKFFLLNQLCYARLKDTQIQFQKFSNKIAEVEDLFRVHERLTGGKACKRQRRHAHELVRNFQCPYPQCYKSYSAEIALNLHIKLKHNGGTKSERQRAAELLWQARQNRNPAPSIFINLPPGYIQQYARTRKVQYLTTRALNQQIYQDND